MSRHKPVASFKNLNEIDSVHQIKICGETLDYQLTGSIVAFIANNKALCIFHPKVTRHFSQGHQQ
jgi:hypothetical protein